MKYNYEDLFSIQTEGIDESLEDYHHNRYEATPYEVLERLLDSHYITKNHILLDFGCGKGRVCLFLQNYTNCTAIGLDYNEKLIEIANKNKKIMNSNCSFVHCDATSYHITTEDCFFFFNPFSEDILRSVLNNIFTSYYDNPRKIKLFFYYPEMDTLAYLMGLDELLCIDEIDCKDLFENYDERENIFVFELM